MYVDTRLHATWTMKFNVPFWNHGDFPAVVQNGTELVILDNPWINGTAATPFDQCEEAFILLYFCSDRSSSAFYLILSLGVGGTNGWFPDSKEKPWLDGSTSEWLDLSLALTESYHCSRPQLPWVNFGVLGINGCLLGRRLRKIDH